MLQVSHLSAEYGGKAVLDDINLTVDEGELLVVLGPSGCGKTTLLNLIAGFAPYHSGSITLQGKTVEGPGAERGVVFQNEGLLPWRSVLHNVAFGLQLAGQAKEQREEIALDMLRKVGLEDKAKRAIWQLSGGQRQRVALARCLVRQQPVLLLDEPFSALDPALRKEMLQLLDELCQEQNMTLLMVSHSIEDAARIAGRSIVVKDGRIAWDGETDTLLSGEANASTLLGIGN